MPSKSVTATECTNPSGQIVLLLCWDPDTASSECGSPSDYFDRSSFHVPNELNGCRSNGACLGPSNGDVGWPLAASPSLL